MTRKEQSIEQTLNELGYDPLAVLGPKNAHCVPDGRCKFDDSLKVLERHGAELLLPFLESEDLKTLLDALHVFSEMRSSGEVLIGPALRYIGHPHPSARWYALDGLLLYLRRLPPKVLTLGLCLANDRCFRVRKKVIEYIAGIPCEKMEVACSCLPPFVPSDPHRDGLTLLLQPEATGSLIERIADEDSVVGCYIGAAILKAAKSGDFATIGNDSSVCEEVVFLRAKLDLMRESAAWRSKFAGPYDYVFEVCPETLKIKGDLDGYGEISNEDLEQAMGELEDSVKARRFEQLDRLPMT
ncbi:hypothetical protein [Pelagibius sp. Alg239-R121]|uniref:hypothetical protein n=1 Tax=Pelagibius sp. Alg239-R121 TaxID=2993448 RepID=UPI0024A64F7D|nr:hypothetical protein [Pelagibius sp. Alg239-R121]